MKRKGFKGLEILKIIAKADYSFIGQITTLLIIKQNFKRNFTPLNREKECEIMVNI